MGVSARNRNESDKEKENEACPNRNNYPFVNPTSFDISEEKHSLSVWVNHEGIVIVDGPV